MVMHDNGEARKIRNSHGNCSRLSGYNFNWRISKPIREACMIDEEETADRNSARDALKLAQKLRTEARKVLGLPS